MPRFFASRAVFIAAALLAVALLPLAGCDEYAQDTPDAVIVSARKMLEDGKAEKLRLLLHTENARLNGVLDRVGAMLGHVQELSSAVQAAFPEEVAELRAQAEEAAKEGKASSLIGSAIMRGTGGSGGRRRQPQRSEEEMRTLFDRTVKEVFADPYGWLERSEGRLSTTMLADDMAAVLWDGKPILPPIGIAMQQVGGKWYILLPTNLPGISSVLPSGDENAASEGWTILEKLIVALDRAMIDLAKDVRSGQARSLREVSEKAGEKAFIPAVIVMIAYGRLMEIREEEEKERKGAAARAPKSTPTPTPIESPAAPVETPTAPEPPPPEGEVIRWRERRSGGMLAALSKHVRRRCVESLAQPGICGILCRRGRRWRCGVLLRQTPWPSMLAPSSKHATLRLGRAGEVAAQSDSHAGSPPAVVCSTAVGLVPIAESQHEASIQHRYPARRRSGDGSVVHEVDTPASWTTVARTQRVSRDGLRLGARTVRAVRWAPWTRGGANVGVGRPNVVSALSPSKPLVARRHAMAYDSRRAATVLFAGDTGAQFFNASTWEWDGNTWDIATNLIPGGRDTHAMAFDSGRGVTVLFGGFDDDFNYLGDTWEWDGARWSRRSVPGPAGRAGHGMAYDSARGVVVLYGGYTAPGKSSPETWEWDGAAWTLRATSGAPPGGGHGMVFDSSRGVCVMSVPIQLGVPNQTWEWNGVSWSRITTLVSPSMRSNFGMCFDARRACTVLYGGWDGRTTYDDLWEYDLYPDCDQSTGAGSLDIFDFLCFQNKYAVSDPYACGCDSSTGQNTCDIFDFLCFQNLFENCGG